MNAYGCFPPGTPVETSYGFRNIEEIQPGDLVLSRDSQSGLEQFKPVLESFVTHPSALYTVSYQTEAQQMHTVTTTALHPFWVVELSRFVNANDLEAGEHFLLADDTKAAFVSETVADAPDGGVFTTFNLEVADFHTYFAGVDGIFVHNGSSQVDALADALLSLHRSIRESAQLNDLQALRVLLDETAEQGPKVDAGLQRLVHYLSDQSFTKAAGDSTKVSSVADLKDLFPTGPGTTSRLAQVGFRNHHTVPEYIQKLLRLPKFDGAGRYLWDDVPSWLLNDVEHTLDEASFHRTLSGFVPEKTEVNAMSDSEIVDGLRKTYEKMEGKPNGPVWNVVQSWLHSKGF
jgi:hypothetical protein